MPVLDLAALLAPVPGDAPCGRDLEYTPELMELEALAAEPDESVLKDIAAVDSRNWRDVRTRALRLLTQSKDLRITALLARALLHTEGVAAYCEALALAQQLVEQYWNGVHPVVAEQGTDAVARLNALSELWNRTLLGTLRSTTLVGMRGLGDFSLRDILIAKGQEKPRTGAQPPSPQLVQRVIDTAPEVSATANSVRTALANLAKLEAIVRERVPDHAFDPAPLREVLVAIKQVLPDTAAQAPAPAPSEGQAPVSAGGAPAAAHTSASQAVVYREREVSSRDDVVALLDKVVAYYEQHEPSSPVPLLMQRARRLVNMNFLELMRDLADKGVPQIEAISGKEPKSS